VRLEGAFAKGRRQIKIKDLAGKLNMSREDVILWMKLRTADPSMAEEVTKKGKTLRVSGEGVETKKSIGTREEVKTARAPINEDGKPYRWWEEAEKWGDRKMTRDQRKTLEHVFETNRFPDDEMLKGIISATRLPRLRIINWFADARRAAMASKTGQMYTQRVKRVGGEDFGEQPAAPDRRQKNRWY